MNELGFVALFLGGFTAGAIALWALQAANARTLRATVSNRDARIEKLQGDVADLMSTGAKLEAQLANERKAAVEKLALLDAAQQKLDDHFRAISAEALRSNNQSFLDLAKSQLEKFGESARGDLEKRQLVIEQTLQPVRESLEKVDAKIAELEKTRSGAYAALHEQVKALAEGQSALRSETTNLVRALRTPAVRGRWGEIQLKRVVEMAGMLGYCDFYEQQTVTTEDGRMRPDLRVRLPGNKNIIVDAKAPLDSYLNSITAPDDETRHRLLKAHAQNIRAHINALSKKSYWDQFEQTPEFVVMFLPGESFFSAALENDPGLIEMGVEQRVILATPTTLIALLRAVHYGWRQEAVALEATQISELGRELYKRLADMSEHFFKLGKSLGGAVDAYNRAIGSLEARVLVSARKFKDMRALNVDSELEASSPVESAPRALQSPELTTPRDGLFPIPEVQVIEENGSFDESNDDSVAARNSGSPSPVFADVTNPSKREPSAEKR